MRYPWRDPQLLMLLATGSLIVMTGAIIAPILPKMVQELGLNPATAGYLVSAHYLTVALFSPLLGVLVDRTGAIRILVISLLLYTVFGALGGLLSGFIPILMTRALVGVASGGIAAASLGLLVKRYDSDAARTQAITYVAVVLTLANILYPVLAGVIGSWHWRWVFSLYGVGLPLAFLVGLTLRPPMMAASAATPAAPWGENSHKLISIIQNPYILQLYVTQCLTAAIAHAAIIYLPLYLKQILNTGTVLNGMVLGSQALGAAIISAWGVRRIARRWGLGGAASLGFGAMAVASMVIPQFQQLLTLLPVVILFGVGLGLVVPSLYSWVANLAPAGLQSSVLAMCVGANFLGQFLAPSIFGSILELWGLSGVFYSATGLALMLGGGLMWLQSSATSKDH